MAFNWQTFRTRTFSAIIFAAVMLVGLFWNQWSFLVLFSIIHFGCWWEYLRLIEKINNKTFHVYIKLGLMVMGFGLMLFFCNPLLYNITGYGLRENLSLPLSIAGFLLLVIGIFQKQAVNVRGFAMAFGGLIYISLMLGLLIDLSGQIFDPASRVQLFQNHNYVLPCMIILSLWINDTMAYLVGSMIGKHPLTKISPKKTWEGTIGGIILAAAVGYAIPALFIKDNHWIDGMTGMWIAFAVSIAGTFGDLFESKLKRMAGVKDSGSMMPGHGGFLDRFDSLLFAIPVAYLLLKPCLFGPC